jgi:phytoene desaturase
MAKKVVIVGTGLGGLSTALRLTTLGFEVEMVEKFHQPGGRLNKLQHSGYTWDMAPTFFSMSYEFKELIDFCGIDKPFEFYALDPLYKVNFSNSKRYFTIHKDIDKLAEEFDGIENEFAEKMYRYLEKTGKLFHDVENRIIRRNFNPNYALDILRGNSRG